MTPQSVPIDVCGLFNGVYCRLMQVPSGQKPPRGCFVFGRDLVLRLNTGDLRRYERFRAVVGEGSLATVVMIGRAVTDIPENNIAALIRTTGEVPV